MSGQDPHAAQPVLTAGKPLVQATGVMLWLHGRGGSAEDILSLGQAIAPAGWALVAPQAAGAQWYPQSFLAPRTQNEPYLSSALTKVQTLLTSLPLPATRVALAGFSQGACLATEFVGRLPQRYAALLAFTGGLIGPPDEPLELGRDLAGTPVPLSSSDPDAHVPWARVEQSAALLRAIGGNVQLVRHARHAHTVGADEVELARALMARL